MKLSIKVVPGSSRDCIAGWLEDTLKVCVATPAEKGKANKAVIKLIAKSLAIPAENIRISKGSTSPRKLLEISGLSEQEVYEKLESI